MTKELRQLKEKADRKATELRKITNQIWSLEQKEELPKQKIKYEGKYFKFDNGYNGTERWWKYMHVLTVNRDTEVICKSFESTSRQMEFNPKDSVTTSLLTVSITKREYERELRKFLKAANQLL